MEPVTGRLWHNRGEAVDSAVSARISDALGLSALAARLLCSRGLVDGESAERFVNGRLGELPDPFLLAGMEAAVERLVAAVTGREKVLVHGDYDVDGISGTALLVEFLSSVGAEVGYHIPLRLKDGYGLSAQAIDKAAAQGVKLVVSVDCGVTAVDEARLAADYGIDLIITDHHQPPERLPQALAIINPHLETCRFADKNLAGVGVAFFLAVGLRKGLRDAGYFNDKQPEPDLRHLLDLVALGTIADVVPLTGVNRLLTRFGLQVLNRGSRAGVVALKQVAAINSVDGAAVGFKLGPRLNAAGRIEDASLGVRLLLTDDQKEADEIAALLDGFNRERQTIEAQTLRQAEERVAELPEANRSIVLADVQWHSGVIGIVASRLVERYCRPTFLLAIENGQAKGSGRSTKDVHLYRVLQQCEARLNGFGGHAAAAGLSVDAGNIEAFAAAFEAAVKQQAPEALPAAVEYDDEVLLEELTRQSLDDLSSLAPFGMGNPSPQFVVRGVALLGLKVVADKHLKFSARQGGYSLSCIAFGMAERMDELEGNVDLLFVPELNHWNGRTEVQLRIRDWRPAETE